MKLLRTLTLAAGAALCLTASAQSNLTPDIIFPKIGSSVIIYGLSDNGKYAVSSTRVNSDEDGATGFAGGALYDISGTTAKQIDLGTRCGSARDVSDDGNVVVGSSSNGRPAFWKDGDWAVLPMPAGYAGGHAESVTPDGKYAVGMVRIDADGMYADGIMWDLTTKEIVDLPNMPKIDASGENQRQNWLTQISADGRYVLGCISFSYPDATCYYVYDRETDRPIFIDRDDNGRDRMPGMETWEMDVAGKSMSTNGRWVAGTCDDRTTGDDLAFYFDVQNEQLYVTNGKNQTDSWAWSITDDGVPLCTRPALDLYGEAYVFYDNYYFSMADILQGVYGINLGRYGIDNTGKPVLVSADGLTVVFITSQIDSHIVRFKEPITAACEKIDLLKNWTSSPVNGTVMSNIGQVQIGFSQYIATSATNYNKVQLLDKDGNLVANPLQNGGLSANNNVLTINFRSRKLNEGETYTLVVPEGIVWVDGRPSNVNKEIRLNFVGRGDGNVKVTKISPASGSAVSTLDYSENPIIITYDASVKINENLDNYSGILYIEGEENPISPITITKYSDKQLVAYPPYLQHLYKGSNYRVVIPEGIAVDISGQGPSEALEIIYEGTYVPQLGDEKYLFFSTCDDYTNFLFYEGDHGVPTQEYQDMGFTQNETPWSVVREDESSTDMAFGSHSCYVDGRQSDDWFSTRQINMPASELAYLTFDAQSYRKNKEDYLKVYVYVDDASINALNKDITDKIRANGDLVYHKRLSPGATEGNLSGEWTHEVIDLAKYAGKNIYIAFLNDNQNQSLVMVDNIYVVRDVKAILTLSNNTNVVNLNSVAIKGRLNIASEADRFTGVSMTLKDAENNVVSTINDPDAKLAFGDLYNFEFPQELPLVVGEEIPFSIEYTVGDETSTYNGVIRDLTFEPVKRVILEKFTGRDCQFCPGGIASVQRLEEAYGDQFIPIEIHCYNMSDPKGMNVIPYAQYFGFSGAPQAIINRRQIAAPIFQRDNGTYAATKANLSESEQAKSVFPLWQDEVADELKEPALMDINLVAYQKTNEIAFNATVKSAINLTDQNIRVFGVLLEDGLSDYQANAYYMTDDVLLGDWGLNGKYGQNTVTTYTFNNVARATWGQSYNGTAGLLPTNIVASEEYKVDIQIVPPKGYVNNPDNLKFVAVLIDENTGRVINACVAPAMVPSGVEGIDSDNNDAPAISSVMGGILIESASAAQAQVFSPSGMLLAQASGQGSFNIDLNGYTGVAIVKAINADGSVSVKLVVR